MHSQYCWWCVHSFDNKPLSLPIDFNEKTLKFNCIGTFCSWNCVKAYNFSKNDGRKYIRSSLIMMMRQNIENTKSFIDIAPPKQCLTMFGGNLSINDFRNNHSVIYNEIPNNIINIEINVEKQVNFKWINRQEANINYSNIDSKNINIEQMKIKKDKQSKNTSKKIEQTLGIFPIT